MQLTEEYDQELADSVLDVSVQANGNVAEELLKGGDMSGALLELMEPVIQKREQQAISQGIQGTICILRDVGIDDQEIKRRIMGQYNLSEEVAAKYLISTHA